MMNIRKMQEELFDMHGGRFAMLAATVSDQKFYAQLPEGYGTETLSVRVGTETRLRINAFAGVAAVSSNRFMNALIDTALDELEAKIFDHQSDAYNNFIGLYETLVLEHEEAVQQLKEG